METAEEFLKRETENFDDTWRTRDSTIRALLKRFAKMHVKAALKAASENAMGVHCTDYVDPDSILNAYPLTNIK